MTASDQEGKRRGTISNDGGGAGTMAGDDFLALFQELGLPENCRLDEFKLAFRRRVAQLHPDRNGDASQAVHLQNLIAAYDAALQFHRRHGRLPGYATATQLLDAPPAQHDSRTVMPPVEPRSRGRLATVLVSISVAALAWWWSQSTTGDSPDAEPAGTPSSVPAIVWDLGAPRAGSQQHLMLGMSKTDVEALEGAPVSTGTDRWDYGPSWIEFKCGEVSDWYNSRLRPLKTYTAHPSADALRAFAPATHGCNGVPAP